MILRTTLSFASRPAALALAGALTIGAALSPGIARAQGQLEIRTIGGAFIPMGDQRDELKGGKMFGLSAAYHLTPKLSLTGGAAWSGSEAKLFDDTPKVNVYHYDVGAEYQLFHAAPGDDWHFRPFIGAGIGGRTYDTEGLDTHATSFTGYGSLGVVMNYKKMGFYVEGRDYLSSYEGLTGFDERSTRNDLGIRTGMSLRF